MGVQINHVVGLKIASAGEQNTSIFLKLEPLGIHYLVVTHLIKVLKSCNFGISIPEVKVTRGLISGQRGGLNV